MEGEEREHREHRERGKKGKRELIRQLCYSSLSRLHSERGEENKKKACGGMADPFFFSSLHIRLEQVIEVSA